MPAATTPLPTGLVTFLFTDIEGSTRIVQAVGEAAYRDILGEHGRIIRTAIADHGGREVSTEGDSFFAVFPSAADGVAATVAAQRGLAAEHWPDGVDVRVRMGLHTGEASLGGDNYLGLDVHRAARVTNAGHGGQVLLSDATHSLVAAALPPGVRLRDLGAHRLKDLATPEHLYQLDVDGLPVEFPTLRSLDARANNLPLQLTSFVGREAEIRAVDELLDTARLVTLIGPGGTGKTRLALQVAAERLGRHGDGAFFVELAPVADAALVPSATAIALHLRESADRSIVEVVQDWLRERDLLLVLDNFEHVLDAGRFVADLLTTAPKLRILVTSRSPLRLQGEHEHPVPPLRIPEPDHLPALRELSQYEGVGLFIERAQAVRADFVVDAGNAPAIAEIVARLDGLPLAIELAAAKCRVFGAQAVLGRLGSRLAFLGGGARDLPARQQTLREAIDWSYRLLAEPTQAALRSLAVFVGGFDLQTAGAFLTAAGSSPDAPPVDALDTVEDLVDQSLLRRHEGVGGEPRFVMLETIREFALERLAQEGEVDGARRRHADVVLATAEELEPRLGSSGEALDAMAREHDNIRAVLSWALETGSAETGLRLGFAAWRFWQRRGHFREARSWFDQLLGLPGAAEPTGARAKGLTGAAGIAYWQNDYKTALAWYAEAEDIVRQLGEPAWLADALYNTAETAALTGELDVAMARLAEGEGIGRELGDDAILGRFLQAAGYMAFMGDQLDAARGPLEEALAVALRGVDPAAIFAGHHTVGQVARLQGRLDDAARHYRAAIRIGFELGDIAQTTEPLQGLAAVLIATGEPERGVRLLAANQAIRERLGGGPPPEWLRLGDPLGDAGHVLDAASYERAWSAGLALSDAEALQLALEDVPGPAAAGLTAQSRSG
jgi:predicted ATPase/class 3 adenylate cyclase